MNEKKVNDGKEFAKKYHSILCNDVPEFLEKYIALQSMQRLDGIGLLCGTDWTPLFNNRFFYSRLDHSVGVALIVWKFTHDKRQTLAGLFHDIATPAFSHVIDFKNGDTKNQESTEQKTHEIINDDLALSQLLFSDGIYKYEIDDYHKYPVADNKTPGLSADRLEYMYPSGAALDEIWNLNQIENNFSFTTVLKNEMDLDEIGFSDADAASEYTQKFLEISFILQKNEDKIAMQLLADVVSRAIECDFINEDELYALDEKSIVKKFDSIAEKKLDDEFGKLWRTFRGMKKIVRSVEPVENSYNISLDVKKRYVDPLIKTSAGVIRISKLNGDVSRNIEDFMKFKDVAYGSVPWL